MKHIHNILLLGGVLMFLAGCAFLQTLNPQYKTLNFGRDKNIHIKVPYGMTDFSGFPAEILPASYTSAFVFFHNPNDPNDIYGFFINKFQKENGNAVVLFHTEGKDWRYWIYRNGIPIEATEDAARQVMDEWMKKKEIRKKPLCA